MTLGPPITVRPPRDGLGAFVPPTPALLTGLASLSILALIALSIELADASASPVGVRMGFLAAMFTALVGVFATLYLREMRKSFIDACLSEAEGLTLAGSSPGGPTDLEHEVTVERLDELSGLLRKTAALEEARRVDGMRMNLLGDEPTPRAGR